MIWRSFDPDQHHDPELDHYFTSLFAHIQAWMGWYRPTRVEWPHG